MAGFIALSFFMKPQLYFDPQYVAEVEARRGKPEVDATGVSRILANPHTVRVVTTSIKDDHLEVLWGEIGRYIQTCRFPLEVQKGGPLIVNHHHLRIMRGIEPCKISYLIGAVSKKGEGLAGHHAAYTLMLGDEASGLEDVAHEMAQGWAKRFLYIGNPNATSNFFYRAVKAGNLLAKES